MNTTTGKKTCVPMHDRINLPVYSEVPVISKFSMRSFNGGGGLIETSHGELGKFFLDFRFYHFNLHREEGAGELSCSNL